MTRIVNISDKPYEFQFDGVVYGPYNPGDPSPNLPHNVAEHGIKRSQINDDMGVTIGFRAAFLDEAKANPDTAKNLRLYECPLVAAGDCNAGRFRTVDELRGHMETHWAATQPDDLLTKSEAAALKTSVGSRQVSR